MCLLGLPPVDTFRLDCLVIFVVNWCIFRVSSPLQALGIHINWFVVLIAANAVLSWSISVVFRLWYCPIWKTWALAYHLCLCLLSNILALNLLVIAAALFMRWKRIFETNAFVSEACTRNAKPLAYLIHTKSSDHRPVYMLHYLTSKVLSWTMHGEHRMSIAERKRQKMKEIERKLVSNGFGT